MPGVKAYHSGKPETQNQILIIGAGGIVRDAHLPAYKKAGFSVFGIVDVVKEKASVLAEEYNIPNVFSNIEDAVKNAPKDVVYDLALNPDQHLNALKLLPDYSKVLLQKPFGTSSDEAQVLLNLCRRKNLVAAVNFQLRFAPFVLEAGKLIDSGAMGEIYDMEIRLTTHTPWQVFPGLADKDRLEILYHSIHYIDLVRSFLGEPKTVLAQSFGHPLKPFSSTRSTILLDYGKNLRAVINTNHDHDFGSRNQESFIKWEGTKGAIKATMGVLMDYPNGAPDQLQYCILGQDEKPQWKNKALEGNWFPDAFVGSMSQLMHSDEDHKEKLLTHVEDAFKTMELVERCFHR